MKRDPITGLLTDYSSEEEMVSQVEEDTTSPEVEASDIVEENLYENAAEVLDDES